MDLIALVPDHCFNFKHTYHVVRTKENYGFERFCEKSCWANLKEGAIIDNIRIYYTDASNLDNATL